MAIKGDGRRVAEKKVTENKKPQPMKNVVSDDIPKFEDD